jgi:uncharacterized UPF0160 family protein
MFHLINKKIKVAVHNGKFHPDDVCAVAILSLYLKKPLKVFRTRDPKIWAGCDYVCDVGGEYNPVKKMFDHHQEGWDEKRENGILYAASGLLWKEYGEKITGSKEIAQKIEETIIEPIDADDNGIELYKNNFEKIYPYSFPDYLFSFNPTWEEKIDFIKPFNCAVLEAKKMLEREIKRAKDSLDASVFVKQIYEKTEDKRIIIFDVDYPWRKALINCPEPLFIIHPRPSDNTWGVETVVKPNSKFERKMYFPKSWSGKRDGELEKITGVSGTVFCHDDIFMAVAKSKDGAIALAKLALKEGLK